MKTILLAQNSTTDKNGYSTFNTLISKGANIILAKTEIDYNGRVVDRRQYTWLNTPILVEVAKSYMELATA